MSFVVQRIDAERAFIAGKLVNVEREGRSLVEFHHIGFVIRNCPTRFFTDIAVPVLQVHGNMDQREKMYNEFTSLDGCEFVELMERIPGVTETE